MNEIEFFIEICVPNFKLSTSKKIERVAIPY